MFRFESPIDNLVYESLNGQDKKELFLDFDLGHPLDVMQSIIGYVNYYYNEQPSHSLQYKNQFNVNLNWYQIKFNTCLLFLTSIICIKPITS